ncbi:zinc-dependent alcohol dehydrogenase [Paenibacillus mendelii]|uniref:Zinc-binding alcohol dehydrogenase n=1 Tax=Paenibacillus mendelii TaxID=206163 RepID=A0ABV6J6R8_9BACL|nr:zinc-binding alcohol dehydrogenase [Paenibacillus mendelii]MCQ6561045.1 zinc-binding alcohol dehydrogenase [Paenibacillus mendelii]
MNYAVQINGNRQAELVSEPGIQRCEPGHVRGQSVYSLISPGTELMSGFMVELEEPRRTGYATVFRIDEVGEGVTDLTVGDHVLCMGSHQSSQHVPAGDTVRLPDGLNPDQGVLARLLNVSMTTLMTTAARPGELVLVTGAGPVGFLAAHLFKRCGYEVMICDPDARRQEAARASGIEHVYAEPPIDDPAWSNRRAALVLECSGHEAAVLAGAKFARLKGEVVLIGVPWKRRTDNYAHELLSVIFHQYVVIRSGWEWEIPLRPGHFQPHSIFTDLHKGMRWLSEGLTDLSVFTRKVSPRNVNEVYNDLADGKYPELFILFDWQGIADT